MAVELKPLVLESTLTMQRILEADDHSARLQLVRAFVEAEIKRLSTKRTLQEVFGSGLTSSKQNENDRLSSPTSKEQLLPRADDTSAVQSSLFDEPDAFQ
jgi:CRISPR/Cas system-associated endonuclease Cas1